MLDDRKQRILQAIIDDYIEYGEPVGSKKVAIKYGIGLSSATIRNEMTLLEELGYITQPHTSAGRIPSERGFRLYVNELISNRNISSEDEVLVSAILKDSVSSVTGLLQKVSSFLSKVSGYTVFGCEHTRGSIIIDAVKILKVEDRVAAVLIIDDNANVYTEIIRVDDIDSDLTDRLSEYLTNKYSKKPIRDLGKEDFSEFEYKDIIKDNVFLKVLYAIKEMEVKNLLPKVYVEGVTNILDYPEFNDVITIKNVINLLNDKKLLLSMLVSNLNGSVDIKIGTENSVKGFENVSIISTKCKFLGIDTRIGVIGPIRMEYGRMIGIMSYLKKLMEKNK